MAALAVGVQQLPERASSMPETAIGTALTATRGAERTARSTEAVRYEDDALVMLGSYAASGGALLTGADDARAVRVWALLRSTLPASGVDAVRQLNLVTDGRDGTLAMVHRSTVDSSTWVLSVDPAEADDVLVGTLVHEYAHMLTLRAEDLLSVAASRAGCAGVRIELGCALEGSALADWHEEFWPDEAAPSAASLVSDYAGTNGHEDLAESFMAWVLDEVERPSAGVRARFAFFAAREELVEARDAIRAQLAR